MDSDRSAQAAYAPPTSAEEATRREVERIIDSYTLCMVGPHSQDYVSACADDVLAELLGWPVRYKTQEAGQ